MKSIVSKAVGGMIVAALVFGNAFAQASGAATESTGANTPAATPSASKAAAKAARQSNRKLGYAVRKAISKVNGVNVSNVTVRAKGGVVTLEGSVPDASQIDKAVDAAKGVSGVASVNNKLSVQPQ
ncbi:BON domain-containing protein [Burkholderia sp. BDU5]|uniref:BON domain-containing protein n=1 Tax=Burkholderia sp. BDU5 TaxID=1385590 RepID=UPI00075858A2|nr:BON domain-containing protein [Burkholderia sp. BDU5]KVE42430.1 phospholipid-binding protein [Burkholderia sp. BDU5]